MRQRHLPQLGKFLSVGVLNMLLGLSVIYACKWFLGAGDVVANAVGYSVGLANSFAFNSRWTFAYRGPQLPALLKFLAVALVAYAMNLLAVVLLIHFGVDSYFAQALGTLPYTVTTYLASKYIVFRELPRAGKKRAAGGKPAAGEKSA